MSSWIICTCGERIHTNLFCGATVYRLISDDQFDGLPAEIALESLGVRFADAPAAFRCRACGRLHVEWQRNQSLTVYTPENWPETPVLSSLDAAAVSRGFLPATLYPDGDVRCPHCEQVFSTRSARFWNGFRHLTCGTFLRLTPKDLNE